MEPDNLRRSWYPIREAAGLGAMRFHDLRHRCVTLLLELGTPPHIVRDIVGHSDIDVTMTIYAHASLEEKRAALRGSMSGFGDGRCRHLVGVKTGVTSGCERAMIALVREWWAGAGSNRRPSAFQADARTN